MEREISVDNTTSGKGVSSMTSGQTGVSSMTSGQTGVSSMTSGQTGISSMLSNRCGICSKKCKYSSGKALCPKNATSIMIEPQLLDAYEGKVLKKVAYNGDNRYYHVIGTNTVIMNVEDKYCILIDYNIIAVDGTEICLPEFLKNYHFTMQNIRYRDWTKVGKVSIGAIIHNIVDGVERVESWKAKNKFTLDHKAETYNEKLCNTKYCKNPVEHSHRVRVEITDMNQLAQFLYDVVYADHDEAGVYYDKAAKKRVTHGRTFVYKA